MVSNLQFCRMKHNRIPDASSLKPLSLQTVAEDQKLILSWFKENSRRLPWRISRDPYRIWISEVMLQQTTVTAVIPFYERFLQKFPNVNSLAKASIEDVYSVWSGLGYYSRARNLHKAAQILAQQGFPHTSEELLKLPGLGPYTARAVSSLAFGERVGVVDGNVIRVLSRKYGVNVDWWNTQNKKLYQSRADELAQCDDPSTLNQALMELGATLCTPRKVTCILCPWQKSCVAFKTNTVDQLPRPKPRKAFESWVFEPIIYTRQQKGDLQIGLTLGHALPVLKKDLCLPGQAKKVLEKPKNFKLKHTITHHQIFISEPIKAKSISSKFKQHQVEWHSLKDLRRKSPSILIQKILTSFLKTESFAD